MCWCPCCHHYAYVHFFLDFSERAHLFFFTETHLAFGKVKYERDDKCVVKDFRDLGYNIRLAQGQKRMHKRVHRVKGKKEERVGQKCALKSIE